MLKYNINPHIDHGRFADVTFRIEDSEDMLNHVCELASKPVGSLLLSKKRLWLVMYLIYFILKFKVVFLLSSICCYDF